METILLSSIKNLKMRKMILLGLSFSLMEIPVRGIKKQTIKPSNICPKNVKVVYQVFVLASPFVIPSILLEIMVTL
jgi:hypothetical protein